MAHDLPPLDALRHLLDRLRANDIAWFRERFADGDLGWLSDRIHDRFGPAEAEALGGHLDSGDLGWVRTKLASLDLPGVVPAAAATTAAATDAATAAAPPVIETAAPEPSPGRDEDERRRRGLLLAIPALLLVAVLLGVGLSRCDGSPSGTGGSAAAISDDTEPTVTASASAGGTTDILSAASSAGTFTTLTAAIDAAGLTGTLQGDGPFTVFAPTDQAFAALPPGLVDALLLPANKDALTKLLTYHVVAGTLHQTDLKTGDLMSLEGDPIGVVASAGSATLNGSSTIAGDEVSATNGIILPVDQVLVPAGFDIDGLLGGATTPSSTIVPAETTVAPTTVAEPTTTATTIEATTTTVAPGSLDIVATAASAGSFGTLAKALDAAGLTSVLQGPGPFTVFAPTDEAFAKVPADVLAGLLQPKNKAILTKVLSYHVLKGAVASSSLKTGQYDTVEGAKMKVTVAGGTGGTGGAVTVDNASVIKADVPAANGVIHVVDAVLIPSDVDLSKLGATTAAATVPSSTVAPPTTVAVPEGLTVYFASGSAVLDTAARAKITGAVSTLRSLTAGSKVKIVGHADSNGDTAANQRLSIRRADAVRAALQAGLGTDSSKITFDVSAVGDSQPDVDLAKSRKVTIEIQP